MPAERDAKSEATYLNPVHARDFPDPYVLKFAGEYFAYCTGLRTDGRAFGVMRSRDLVRWEELGGALEPLPGEHPCYWAPEVFYRNGKFLMYYSVGNEKLMHVRVAVADRPTGPFVDSGRRLTAEEFAIDPHVFVDADGARYLFYATDFLTHTHIGTGTVVDRLLDDFTLAGRARPVTRARYDWQVYDPNRREKGGVRWHTVEGPFVLARKGLYYEMFSGGNWQNVSYGVSYAVSDRILNEEEWAQHADGLKTLPVLRTIPGEVVGPGHNSVVRGPDNQQLFCVYHRWAEQGRVLAIDRMEFVGDALAVVGPTTTPQPAPVPPWFADYFDAPRAEGLGEGWSSTGGRWSVLDGEARQESRAGAAEARCADAAPSFVAEVTLRALAYAEDITRAGDAEGVAREDDERGGVFGACVWAGASPLARVRIEAGARRVVVETRGGGESPEAAGEWSEAAARALPGDFDAGVYHTLRAEADGSYLRFALDDGVAFDWRGSAERGGEAGLSLSLFTEDRAAAFCGFTRTRGFADEFEDAAASVARGWGCFGGEWYDEDAEVRIEDQRLRLATGYTARRAAPAAGSYELVVNVRAEAAEAAAPRLYGIAPGAVLNHGTGLTLVVERAGGEGWRLAAEQGEDTGDERRLSFALPPSFDPFEFQQFRLLCGPRKIAVLLGGEILGECEIAGLRGMVSVSAWDAAVAVDLVRLTEIKTP